MTSDAGRQHIFGQSLHDKRELIRGWILRDHRPVGVREETLFYFVVFALLYNDDLCTVHVCMYPIHVYVVRIHSVFLGSKGTFFLFSVVLGLFTY